MNGPLSVSSRAQVPVDDGRHGDDMPMIRSTVSWRRLAVLPILTLLVVVIAWNGAAIAIDASSLEQHPDSWGILFGSILWTVVGGGVPAVLTAGTAIAAMIGAPDFARRLVWCGAVLDASCAAGLVLFGLAILGGPAAEVVFGFVTLGLAFVMAAPLALCVVFSGRLSAAR